MVVEALHAAYESAQEKHDESCGSDATTFGLEVYKFGVHELRRAVHDGAAPGVAAAFVRQAFRLQVGPFTVAYHKVGRTRAESIWQSFPKNRQAAHRLVGRQQFLPGFGPDLAGARSVVIAHLGNPETGLEAVYLCIPTAERNSRISEWGYAACIWERAAVAGVPAAQQAVLVPPESIKEPRVVPKRRAKVDESDE